LVDFSPLRPVLTLLIGWQIVNGWTRAETLRSIRPILTLFYSLCGGLLLRKPPHRKTRSNVLKLSQAIDRTNFSLYNDYQSVNDHWLLKKGTSVTTRARREREKRERRQSILRAAREAFFENGFHNTTMDNVAGRAEVSKGTVYLYFKSKETILAHLLLEGLDELVGELEQAYAAREPFPADERLRRLAWAYLGFFQRKPQYFPFLMAMDGGRFQEAVPSPIYQEILEASLEGLNLVVKAIEQGNAEGLFEYRDTQEMACIFLTTMNGVLQLMEHPLRREMVGMDRETLYRAALETMIRGLQATR
jgi:AcrR family transcriptional regulator